MYEIPTIVLPPPSLVATKLYDGLVHGAFLENLTYTLTETLLGFGIAAVLGIVLGALVSEIRWVRRAIYPTSSPSRQCRRSRSHRYWWSGSDSV